MPELNRPLCANCSYPDCLVEVLRLDRIFSEEETLGTTNPATYDPSTVLAARALYNTCYNYRKGVDIAQDLLE